MCFGGFSGEAEEEYERFKKTIIPHPCPKYDFMTHCVIQNSELVFEGSLEQCKEYCQDY